MVKTQMVLIMRFIISYSGKLRDTVSSFVNSVAQSCCQRPSILPHFPYHPSYVFFMNLHPLTVASPAEKKKDYSLLKLIIYLAGSGPSCSMQDICCSTWALSSCTAKGFRASGASVVDAPIGFVASQLAGS